jgi:acyl-CoA synthetase (NDP forming)
MSSRPGVMNAQQAKGLRESGLVQIGGTRQGLGAIDRIGRYMMPQRPLRTSANRSGAQLADLLAAMTGRRTVNEYESKRLLSAFGVPVTREHRVTTLEEATRAAHELGYPVVLNALSDDIPHKTELGLVAVGLANDGDLASAFQRLQERLDRIEPRPSDAALLVQEFVAGGIEVFAGVSRDPDFGLTLAFGMGGIAIEITRDFSLRTLPLRERDAEAMIAETRGAAMLGAIRGRPAADVAILAACLNALADFAHHNADVLEEIDLNPIKALPEGRGCVVVDALIVARSPARG